MTVDVAAVAAVVSVAATAVRVVLSSDAEEKAGEDDGATTWTAWCATPKVNDGE